MSWRRILMPHHLFRLLKIIVTPIFLASVLTGCIQSAKVGWAQLAPTIPPGGGDDWFWECDWSKPFPEYEEDLPFNDNQDSRCRNIAQQLSEDPQCEWVRCVTLTGGLPSFDPKDPPSQGELKAMCEHICNEFPDCHPAQCAAISQEAQACLALAPAHVEGCIRGVLYNSKMPLCEDLISEGCPLTSTDI